MFPKEKIKEYFSFTKGERDGILVLIIVIIIAIGVNIFSDVFYIENAHDFSQFESELEEFNKNLIPYSDQSSERSYSDLLIYDTIDLFKFDPNNSSKDEFLKLGLTEKQIQTIGNYITKGGKFRYRSDFKKIYGIPEDQYLILYSYIDLPDKKTGNITSVQNDAADKNLKSELFYFDPNTIEDSEWMKLGFTEKQVSVIRKYIDKGGKFRKKGDLKNIYIISDDKYEELSSFIKIEQTYDKEEKLTAAQVDLNSFSKDDFIDLGSSWKYLAGRIVNFRNILGGYHKKEQLLEVYGFKNDFYKKIAGTVYIDLNKVVKININFAEKNELAKHPYISYEVADKILTFRNKKGPYKQLNELIINDIISKDLFDKLSPYLKVK